jgi:hypothetical protein
VFESLFDIFFARSRTIVFTTLKLTLILKFVLKRIDGQTGVANGFEESSRVTSVAQRIAISTTLKELDAYYAFFWWRRKPGAAGANLGKQPGQDPMGNCIGGGAETPGFYQSTPLKPEEFLGGALSRSTSAGRDAPSDAVGGGGLRQITLSEVAVSVPQN